MDSSTAALKKYAKNGSVADTDYKNWYSPNNEIKAYDLPKMSSFKVEWICPNNHSFNKVVRTFMKNPVCDKCELNNLTSLYSVRPDLVKYWSSKNNKSIFEISYCYTRKVLLVCDCSYEFLQRVQSIKEATVKELCPVCDNKVLVEGINDLKTLYPEIAKTIINADPSKILIKSNDKFLWQCQDDKSHQYVTTASQRIAGVNCKKCSAINRGKERQNKSSVNSPLPDWVKELWSEDNIVEFDKISSRNSHTKIILDYPCGHTRHTSHYNIYLNPGCSQCSKGKPVSKAENEIADFVQQYFKIERNNRSVLNGQELDIYIPSKNIAIEYNGLYWHSEKSGKDRWYHYNKWNACKDKGIQLITIWEDDWRDKTNIVKRMLLHKLCISQQENIYARNTNVVELKYNDAKAFLDKNHIQGSAAGMLYLGLEHDEAIVAVMVIQSTPKSETLISRYATSQNVIGGFSKLLKHVERLGFNKIVTFSDNSCSDGGLYSSNGFKIINGIDPDYYYISNNTRYHKFLYRKNRFKTDSNLIWDKDLTERELAELNCLYRLWDCGKIKWEKM